MTGKIGKDSIRIDERKIDELNHIEYANIREDLADFDKTDRETKENAIKARYPKMSVSYLDGRINEARDNIERVRTVRDQETQRITDYTALITLCQLRDKQIDRLDESDPNYEEDIKIIKTNFPPYNVDALKTQIVQSQESLERFEHVIAQEFDSIEELQTTKAKCQARDAELERLRRNN